MHHRARHRALAGCSFSVALANFCRICLSKKDIQEATNWHAYKSIRISVSATPPALSPDPESNTTCTMTMAHSRREKVFDKWRARADEVAAERELG